jgi:hypothetical protein
MEIDGPPRDRGWGSGGDGDVMAVWDCVSTYWGPISGS